MLNRKPADPDAPMAVTDVLRHRAAATGDFQLFTFVRPRHPDRVVTYRELHRAASHVAQQLRQAGAVDQPVLLLYPPGPEFLAAYLGCLYSGAIAVPCAIPSARGDRAQAESILRDTAARHVATTEALAARVARFLDTAKQPARILTTGFTTTAEGDDRIPPVGDLAMLQYTSGSTETPRGVRITHDNLAYNLRAIQASFEMSHSDRGLTWLPHHHDMGLIGGLLVPLFTSTPTAVLSTVDVMRRPLVWLESISRFRATITGGPCFVYDWCARADGDPIPQLDLDCWRLAYCGAEPIREDVLNRFADRFADAGFRRSAVFHCYGLAEATLLSAGAANPPAGRASDPDGSAAPVACCGVPPVGHQIRIVEPESLTECADGRTGEIWLSGPSVADGYWNRPQATRQLFAARLDDRPEPYLRTGDLGFLQDGQLFVTGRRKDVIIIRGRNIFPQDLEKTASAAHPDLQPTWCAAFGIAGAAGEAVVMVHELKQGAQPVDPLRIVAAIRENVLANHGIGLQAVVLLPFGKLPKTTSGKVKRTACRSAYLAGALRSQAIIESNGSPQPVVREVERDATCSHATVQRLREAVATELGVRPDQVDPQASIAELGLDSARIPSVSRRLEDLLGRRLDFVDWYDAPTLASLATIADPPAADPNEAPVAGRATEQQEPLAVVGLACRFPGAPDLPSFWKLLREGTDAVSRQPHRAGGHANGSHWGGYLPDVEWFDAAAFGICPREARVMDPQQRLLLEVTHESLVDAGHNPQDMAGSSTGVFVGVSHNDYADLMVRHGADPDPFLTAGNALSLAANRLSFHFDFRGPSLAVDTACSSSLVATHLACRSLRADECRLAVAAGVNLILSDVVTRSLARNQVLSGSGRCRSFGQQADGYVRGEGCGAVVLKRLSDAIADGDAVYALIRGTAVGQDGKSHGLTAPRPAAQRAVLAAAYRDGNVRPGDVGYVEAHGSGTRIGDGVEARVLNQVMRVDRKAAARCLVGSVKSNLGHLESAAGIAGLIKTAVMIHHRQIPPSLHAADTIEEIARGDSVLQVPSKLGPWSGDPGLLAGVSSFGFGGTNAHVVLQEPPASCPRPTPATPLAWNRQPFWFTQSPAGPQHAAATNRLAELDPPGREEHLAAYLRSQVAGQLGVTPAGLDPDLPLVELGVDSMMAVELLHDLETDLGLTATLDDVAAATSLADIAARLSHRPIPTAKPAGVAGEAGRPPRKEYPATELQQQLWALGRWIPHEPVLTMSVPLRLTGRLDHQRLEQALRHVVERHAVLRTSFREDGDKLVQTVSPPRPVRITAIDLSHLAENAKERHLEEEIRTESRSLLPADQPPLYRATLIHLGADEHVLVWTVNHLIVDGWSLSLIANEFLAAYAAPEGVASVPPDVSFGEWSLQAESDDRLSVCADYWSHRLKGVPLSLELPLRRVDHDCVTCAVDNHVHPFSRAAAQAVASLARRRGVSRFAVLLAALQLVVHRHTDRQRFVVAVPFGRRHRADQRQVVGPVLQPLPVLCQVSAETTVSDVIDNARDEVEAAGQHDQLSFNAIWNLVQPASQRAQPRCLPLLFDYQDGQWIRNAGAALNGRRMETRTAAAGVELGIYVRATEDGVTARLDYQSQRFAADDVRRLAAQLDHALIEMSRYPESPIQSLSYLPDDEQRRVTLSWNATQSERPGVDIVDRIARQWRDAADEVAVVDHRAWTYHELRERVERVAGGLSARGLGPGSLVGIQLERSADVVAAMLAVLRVGAAYLPLDPRHPAEHLERIVGDAVPQLRMTSDVFAQLAATDEPMGHVPCPPRDTAAYVLYTSGSTGRPKGVQVTRGNLANFMMAMDHLAETPNRGVWLATTSVAFDISAFELLWPLTQGYQIVLQPGPLHVTQHRTGHSGVAARIRDFEVTHFQCTPSLLALLLEDPEFRAAAGRLQKLFVGGEALSVDLAQRVAEIVPGDVYNMYGPTETTIWSTVHRVQPGAEQVPIGRPIANTRAWVLDDRLRVQPIGVPGELYLAGAGVAAGYWREERLTAGSFLAMPREDGPVYRTGDRVRWNGQGELEFLGRVDRQIKRLGHRIEPAEIESVLGGHPDVDQAVVMVDGDATAPTLVACVAGATPGLDVVGLRDYLRTRVPPHLIPDRFAIVDRLPLTQNGKIDRKAALAAAPYRPTTPRPDRPATHLVRRIQEILCDELGFDEAGPEQDWSRLALDSLSAIRVTRRLERDLRRPVSLWQFLQAGNAAALARLMTASEAEALDEPERPSEAPSLEVVEPSTFDLAKRNGGEAAEPWRDHDDQDPFVRLVEPVKGYLLSRVALDVPFERGEGCYLYDAHGTRYLDCVAQYGALPFGHNPPAVWEAIAAARRRGAPNMAAQSRMEFAGRLAERLIDVAPAAMRHVTFCNSGAEAVEVALKLCRSASGRVPVLAARRAFHGLTLGALAATASADFRARFAVPESDVDHVDYGDIDALATALRKRSYAAVILEPIQGEGGVRCPPAGYLGAVAELCRASGTLLIVDEVQTGLGRTGTLFACQQEGIAPDVITLAKALGGGLMPIGAVLCGEAAYSQHFGLRHSSTFAGNTLACVAGLATLDLLEQDDGALVANVAKRGRRLAEDLQQLRQAFPELVTGVTGRGFLQGVELDLSAIPSGGLLPCLADQQVLIHLVVSYLLHVEHIRVAPSFTGGSRLRLEPPLTAGTAELALLVSGLRRCLAALRAGDTGQFLWPLGERTSPVPSAVALNANPAPRPGRASPPGTPASAADRFGFVVHLDSLHDFRRFDATLGSFGESDLRRIKERLSRHIEPFEIGTLDVPLADRVVQGQFVLIPFTAEELTAMPRAAALRMIQAAARTACLNTSCVGLGGFSSVLSHGGAALAREELLPLTSGNAYTSAVAAEAVRAAVESRGNRFGQQTVAVVGAAGSIGRTVALLLADAKKIVLIGRPGDSGPSRLTRVSEEIGSLAAANGHRVPCVEVATSPTAVQQASVVVTAASTTREILTAADFGPESLVCDVGRPFNVDRADAARRHDLTVLEGGLVRIPGARDAGIFAGPAPDRVFACVAEAVLWTIHRQTPPSVDAPWPIDVVRQLSNWSRDHGFEIISEST